jgi:hypothetical protein
MRWYRLVDRELVLVFQPEAASKRRKMRTCALAVGALRPGARRTGEAQTGDGAVDRDPDAPEAPAEAAMQIKKAEMQPRRRADDHLPALDHAWLRWTRRANPIGEPLC